jgi:hypothetical protein
MASFIKNTTPVWLGIEVCIIAHYCISVNHLGIPNLPYLASHTPFVRQRQAGKVDGMNTPQQLSGEAIEEFKAIYQEEFGEILSDDEVQEIAMRLLRFFGILNKGK